MKTKILAGICIASIMAMATDNLAQALTALCIFGICVMMLRKRKIEASAQLRKFEVMVGKLINR